MQEALAGITASSLEVRDALVEALHIDLIGPPPDHELAEERLPGHIRPSTWYLTGFLIPSDTPVEENADPDEDEELDEVPGDAGLPEESSEERRSAKKAYFPSSIGLSFLVAAEAAELRVSVTWGDYSVETIEDDQTASAAVWQRRPREAELSVSLPRDQRETELEVAVPDSEGLVLHASVRQASAPALAGHLPPATRAVSLFLVNRRRPQPENPDRAYAFQPRVAVSAPEPFVPRPDLSAASQREFDDRVADLHYADCPEYAVGHGVAADWELIDGRCHLVRTAWIPSAQVERTETAELDGVELSMEALGVLSDGAAASGALTPLVEQYRTWIGRQHEIIERRFGDSDAGEGRATAEELLHLAAYAAGRIERGIAVLAEDSDALDAFRLANRAVARALRQRARQTGRELLSNEPAWRAFQLAFILLNLPGIPDPTSGDRDTVDLLFFPTGGGKTEAYFGLAAFAMVLRRLRHPQADGRQGAGVSVVMRYTLRLLTLDQLTRAAGLVCALELERERHPERYGTWRFEIGLWVGKAATPNLMGRRDDRRNDTARKRTIDYQNEPDRKPPPIPLESCPWCGTRFGRDSFTLQPNADNPCDLRVVCANPDCDFTRSRSLPVVAVDEPLYRRLPAFLIATVDKFAALPWVGPSGALLGGADRYDEDGFYGAAEPGRGTRLPSPLPPPDLVIQDELHLITGPLGTMAGLYETSIEALCTREQDGRRIKPKIVASTATVRRAQTQVQALFGRGLTQIFPPQGIERRDCFFAQSKAPSELPARRYVGVACQGRSPKVMMRRVYLALMGAAQKAYLDAGGTQNHDNPADPYMTILGYFTSLRELGGARRILEEEVQNTLKEYGQRRRVGEQRGLFRDRRRFSGVVELTSREPTHKVAEARGRLGRPFYEEGHIDCALATNMISVGLDVQRLGLMVVVGQPKSHSEYIQATSRVGRDAARPGLIVTLHSIHKPRDRSHHERFRHYHETFYRTVEAGSVTPFAARALDRGFPGALVALSRHAMPALTPPLGAERLGEVRAVLETLLRDAFTARVLDQPLDDEQERAERLRSVQDRIVDLLDSWLAIYADYRVANAHLQYQRYEKDGPKWLLHDLLDATIKDEQLQRKFRVGRSLRDVEPEVNLYLSDLPSAAEMRP